MGNMLQIKNVRQCLCIQTFLSVHTDSPKVLRSMKFYGGGHEQLSKFGGGSTIIHFQSSDIFYIKTIAQNIC